MFIVLIVACVAFTITQLLDVTLLGARVVPTLADAAPDVLLQQTDFILQVRTRLGAAFLSRFQPRLDSVDGGLHMSQRVLRMILQRPQLCLHLPTQVAAQLQQLHLRHYAVEMFTAISGEGLDLIDVLAQVQNLREITVRWHH